jgi:hypothetical protein
LFIVAIPFNSFCPQKKGIVVSVESLTPLSSPNLSSADRELSSANKPVPAAGKATVLPTIAPANTSPSSAADAFATLDASESFLVHKCICVLARQNKVRLQLSSLREELCETFPSLDEKLLIELCLQYSHLFALFQDSQGDLNAQLNSMDVDAAQELLSLASNVSCWKDKKLLPSAGDQTGISAWVRGNTILLDGLNGHYCPERKNAAVFFGFGASQLRIEVEVSPFMKSNLSADMPVRVCLKILPTNRFLVHVFLLTLTVQLDGGQEKKVLTDEGKKFKFNETGAVRISAEAAVFPNGELKKGPAAKTGFSPQPHSESAHSNDADTGMKIPNVHVPRTFLLNVTTYVRYRYRYHL